MVTDNKGLKKELMRLVDDESDMSILEAIYSLLVHKNLNSSQE